MDWFQTGKGVHQGCVLLPCLFNLYVEYIMRNAGLEWTVNFQMYKLDLEKAEEPEIKLQTSIGS